MRVCLLNDSFPPVIDGVANVVLNYAKILQSTEKCDVMVGTPRYPDADYSEYPYRVISYHSFDTTKIVKGYRAGNPLDIRELKDMTEFEPDIIHTHCPVSSTVLARMIRAKTGAPVIFTYHTKFDIDIAKAVKAKFLQKESIKALVSNIEACDEVWTVSHGAGENLRSLGYSGEYHVVSNGVDFAKGRPSGKLISEVTSGYDLPKGIPVFLFVGRLVRYKGIFLILEALSKLSAAKIDFRMVYVGSGPDEIELKDKAKEYGFDNNLNLFGKCIFTGSIYDRDELRAWNARSDLFLFPSTYDTNGIVVREAAACGLASVLIKGSCAAEGILDAHNGYVIEESADAMYKLLENLCSNMNEVHQVGENAMNEIYISWDESVHAAYKRYAQILDEKKLGQFEVKKAPLAEHFKKFSENLIEDTHELMHYPRTMFEGMRDNVYEIKQEITDMINRR